MDPCHFGTDPDSRICITALRIRIWILLFKSLADKRPAKKKFLKKNFCLLLFEGTFTSVIIDNKSKRSHKIVEIRVFLLFYVLMEGSRSGRPKNIRIRIHDTGLMYFTRPYYYSFIVWCTARAGHRYFFFLGPITDSATVGLFCRLIVNIFKSDRKMQVR